MTLSSESERPRLMRVKRSASVLVSTFIIGLVGSLSITSAQAGYAQSTIGSFTTAGVSYKNASDILTQAGADSSGSLVRRSDGSNAPTGHIGAMARGYRSSNGNLACSTQYVYSGSPQPSFLALCTFSGVAGYSYYGYGISKSWNGSAYAATFTPTSPSQTA